MSDHLNAATEIGAEAWAERRADEHGSTSDGARALGQLTNWILAIYLVAVLALMLILHVWPSIDVMAVLLALAAVLVGRGKAFVRDWGPFVVIFLGWEAMRGVANQFGQAVQSESIVQVTRFLFFGHVPSADLQGWLHVPGQTGPLDVAMSLVYISHFFFPIALAFFFWLRYRRRYYRFVITLLVVSFAAFTTFLLLPVAPPRFADLFGADLHVEDITSQVAGQLGFGFDWAYRHLVGNPVAAFPSMHAAYPTLVFLFLRERWPRRAWLWVPFMVTIWFAVVYLGHHYVIDVVGGIVYAVVGYRLVRSTRAARLASGLADSLRHALSGLARTVRRGAAT